jgi:DegV family protein with EDD domain
MVAIVADSAANVPAALARELGIQVVPMYLRFGDRSYRDGVEMAPEDFYRRLAREPGVASTSTPPPGDFLEAYGATGQAEIVCVTVASQMSAAHHQAGVAAERFDGRVEVIDSGSASMAEGFVAIEAARAARAGAGIGEVAERARRVASRAGLFATLDSFEYLRRSGRVRALQAYAATVLDIRPVFAFRDGQVGPVARPRTRRRALARVVQETLAATAGRPVHLAAVHADAEEDAAGLVRAICEGAEVVESFVTAVTPVIGAHVGPGLVGAAFYCD